MPSAINSTEIPHRASTRGARWLWRAFLVGASSAFALAVAQACSSGDEREGRPALSTSRAQRLSAFADGGGATAQADAAAVDAVDAGSELVPENGCCTASSAPGCNDPEVLACVCEGDAFCCNDSYDALCVRQGISRCGVDCDARPPASDCCSPSSVPGCSVPDVEACICAVDPFCCVFRFDDNCVNLATAQCSVSCDSEEARP
jgi:hypothetical protein